MDKPDEKRPQKPEEPATEELAEETTAEISGGLFPSSSKPSGGSKTIYKIPAPPAPYVPVPYPSGS